MLQLHGENTVRIAYNDRSEVTGFNVNRGQDSALRQTYRYDGIGNRERFTSEIGDQRSEVSYQTNDLNQYTGITQRRRGGEWAPTHDLDGNLTEDSRNRYTWNGENRLTRVESKDGSALVVYTYDYQGRRTTKRSVKNEEQSTIFIYDGWNLLAEVQGSPSALRSKAPSLRPVTYTWGRDLSGTLQGAGGVGGLLAVSSADDNHRYPCYDANGNIGQMIDNRAVMKAAYQYDAFGSVTDQAGDDAEGNRWRFSTKPAEDETGWYYYGFRCYDPETGQWPSRDPIEEEGGVNLYGFVGNNGISNWDFLGLEFKQGVFSAEGFTAAQLAADGARIATQLSAIFLRDMNQKREFGGTICEYECTEDEEKFFYVSMIVIGPPKEPGKLVSVTTPRCPEFWEPAHDFHSHPFGSGGPNEWDILGAKKCPGCVGLHHHLDGRGQLQHYNRSGNDGNPIPFEFDPSISQNEFIGRYSYTHVNGYKMPQVPCPCSCPTCEWSQ